MFLAVLAALAAPAGGCPSAQLRSPTSGVLRIAPFGAVVAPTPADANAAVAGGDTARRAARRYLRLDLPKFVIAMGPPDAAPEPVNGCAFAFHWTAPPPGAPRPPSHVLPHEIGHAVFTRFLVPDTRGNQYGGDAPDWLDEMAAVAFENAEGVAARRADAHRLAARGDLIPLARLLTMTHPEWQPKRIDGRPGLRLSRSPDTPGYYATVRALLDYLIHVTHDVGVVRRLADEVREGRSANAWIVAHLAHDSESDLSQVDEHIKAFVLGDRAYRQE